VTRQESRLELIRF